MRYIESPSTDPHFNLALEQYVFDSLERSFEYFMLWQNDNAVIVGKHQNTIAEVNCEFVDEHGVSVVRRMSGGGAVYHDLGNINFTFIVDAGDASGFDFSTFCAPVVKALASFGVKAQVLGRNDIVIDGMKFSGNAQYVKRGRVMHHGTIMFDCDLDAMRGALGAPKGKIESKGTKSVRSSVTNIKPYVAGDISTEDFFIALRQFMFAEYDLEEYKLTDGDIRRVDELRSAVYDTWEWNYGYSPKCSIVKERRVEGCGTLQAHMEVDGGRIREIAFFGDYFGSDDAKELETLLLTQRLKEGDLRETLSEIDVGKFFFRMDADTLISILLQ